MTHSPSFSSSSRYTHHFSYQDNAPFAAHGDSADRNFGAIVDESDRNALPAHQPQDRINLADAARSALPHFLFTPLLCPRPVDSFGILQNALREDVPRQYRPISTALKRDLHPVPTDRDLGRDPIITPAPSPLLKLLCQQAFCDLRIDQAKLLPGENLAEINIDEIRWGEFCDNVRNQRQLLRQLTKENLSNHEEIAAASTARALRDLINDLQNERLKFLPIGELDEIFEEQVEVLQSFLSARAGEVRAWELEANADQIGEEMDEGLVHPMEMDDGVTQRVLSDLLCAFALDLLKAQEKDLFKRLQLARELALLMLIMQEANR